MSGTWLFLAERSTRQTGRADLARPSQAWAPAGQSVAGAALLVLHGCTQGGGCAGSVTRTHTGRPGLFVPTPQPWLPEGTQPGSQLLRFGQGTWEQASPAIGQRPVEASGAAEGGALPCPPQCTQPSSTLEAAGGRQVRGWGLCARSRQQGLEQDAWEGQAGTPEGLRGQSSRPPERTRTVGRGWCPHPCAGLEAHLC